MTRKLIISFLLIFFVVTYTNSLTLKRDSITPKEEKSIESINKRQTPGPDGRVYYAQFDPYFYPFNDYDDFDFVTIGYVTFNKLNDNSTRIYGQCNTGFVDPDPYYYSLWIVPYPLCPSLYEGFNLTPYLTYSINVPGTSAFQYDFSPDFFTFEQIYHYYFIVRHGGYTIGAAQIKGVAEP